MNLPNFYFGENYPQILNYYVQVSGGARVGGAATVSDRIVQIYTITPSGGVRVGGTSPAYPETYVIPAPTGGVTVGGIAPDSELYVNLFAITPSGGVAIGGAPLIREVIPVIPVAGVTVGGRAAVSERIAFVPAGGLQLGGTGSGAAAVVVTPAGGIAIGGTASPTTIFTATPAGGIALGGGASVVENPAVSGSGGITLGGAAPIAEASSFTATPSGGLVLSGSSTIAGTTVNVYDIGLLDVLPQGGMLLSGAATILHGQVFLPAGGAELGGAAAVVFIQPLIPVGGVEIAGTALAYAVLFGDSVTAENPYNEDFPGWAINAESGVPSRYLRLPANSFCQFGGQTYAANAGGIYLFGADDDAGQQIHAGIEIGQSDYGSRRSKRIPDLYLGMRSSGQMRLSVLTNQGGERHYYAIPKTEAVLGAVRVKLGKGLEGRYWSKRLENVAGADFELESMAFSPVELTRYGR